MEDAAIECPVCMMKYSDPQLLSTCGHTFCRRCIDSMQPSGGRLLCALCHTVFQRPNDVRPNYALSRMLEHECLHAPPPASAPPQGPAAPLASAQAFAFPSSTQPSNPNRHHGLYHRLERFGAPYGLCCLLGEEDNDVVLRVFLLDNSGSTMNLDGAYLDGSHGAPKMVDCSRWEEIRRMAIQQAEFNIALETRCEFVLLNSPSSRGFGQLREGVDICTIDPCSANAQAQMVELKNMLQRTRPQGLTPLAERISEIHQRMQRQQSDFEQHGHKAILVIATDGCPSSATLSSDGAKTEVVQVLRQLVTQLPVFLVIRLCTDEQSVVDYYNRIDEEEELPLEVLDDIESEAKEVAQIGNGWLTYSPLIHMIRESGTFLKLFDLLDERKLTPLEVRLLVGHMLQGEDEAPLPLSDVDAFHSQARTRLKKAPQVYDVPKRRLAPVIDPSQFRKAIGKKAAPCGCLSWLPCFACLR